VANRQHSEQQDPGQQHWIDVTAGGRRVRHTLRGGLTRLGGPGCDVEIEGSAGDELHFWSDPPKVLRIGQATAPLLNGRVFDEAALENGDSIQWGGAVLVYGRPEAALLEELPTSGASPEAPFQAPPIGGDVDRFHQRLLAGVLADLNLADGKERKRWQDAVQRGQFDPDACARDLLGTSSVAADDPRVLERAGRLQRDLLMMSLQRGIKGIHRRARGATRSGVAYLVGNLIAISVYSLVLLAIMVLVRLNYDFSFDRVIDRLFELF
jgi:hypothetical protein